MRAVLLLLAILVSAAVPAVASEAADCAVAPVPARPADRAAADDGPLASTSTGLAALNVTRLDARANATRAVGVDVATVDVETVQLRRHAGGTTVLAQRFHYDLVGTRATTCFTWPAASGFAFWSARAWHNATAASSITLEIWAG